jgi:hypothetical protein
MPVRIDTSSPRQFQPCIFTERAIILTVAGDDEPSAHKDERIGNVERLFAGRRFRESRWPVSSTSGRGRRRRDREPSAMASASTS